MKNKIRKVCVVVNSRANYGRIRSFMQAVEDHDKLELQLIVGASALLYRFGMAIDLIKKDGFVPNAKLYSIVEGETPATMAKSTGLAITELATLFENLKPDIVLTVADRFETMATAIAASYMNIPLAHTQGGEVTGSIDESVRHSITKLSHIHFPATEMSVKNLIKMGENPDYVFNVGCPAIDAISDINLDLSEIIFENYLGVGTPLNFNEPYLVVLQHPVTTEYGCGFQQINETIQAIESVGIQTAWLWPNVDAGSDDISKGLRVHREKNPKQPIHFYRHFGISDYARLINNCSCLVGNSSSALREGAFLGVPSVNIGTRQQGREHSDNVVFVDYNKDNIIRAISNQVKSSRYASSKLYGDGSAGKKMANILSDIEIKIQKKLHY